MLHDRYYEILKIFLGDLNREVYGRELVGKVGMSQKSIALCLSDLETKGVLKSKKRGNTKYYKLNLENTEIKEIIIITEFTRKIIFLKEHRKISSIFKKGQSIVGVFGSYARGDKLRHSDLDVFIVGTNREDYVSLGKKFNIDVSVKHFTFSEFKKLVKEKNSLVKEIISNHALLFGIENFVNLLWEDFYGYN